MPIFFGKKSPPCPGPQHSKHVFASDLKNSFMSSSYFLRSLFIWKNRSLFFSLPFFRSCHGLRNRGPLDPGFRSLYVRIYKIHVMVFICAQTLCVYVWYIHTHLPLLPQEPSLSRLETWTIFKGKYGFLWPTLTSKKSSKHLIKAKGNSFDALLDFVSTFLAGLQPASDWSVPQAKQPKQTIPHEGVYQSILPITIG